MVSRTDRSTRVRGGEGKSGGYYAVDAISLSRVSSYAVAISFLVPSR